LDGEPAVLVEFIEFSIWEISPFEPNVAPILSSAPCICYALPVVFLQLIIMFKEGAGYPKKDVVIDPFRDWANPVCMKDVCPSVSNMSEIA